MNASITDLRFCLLDETLDEFVNSFSRFGFDRLGPEPKTTLTGPNGECIALPPEVFKVLHDAVMGIADGQAVTIAHANHRLTTQEAADLLGISRSSFVNLLDAGELDFKKIGRHRRVLLTDVLEYQQRRSERRRKALDRIVEISHESNMYELTATPQRTR